MPDQPKRRGGARPGAGRKPLGAAPLIRKSVGLSQADWDYLESRNVDASKALREVIAQARSKEDADLAAAVKLVDDGASIPEAILSVLNKPF